MNSGNVPVLFRPRDHDPEYCQSFFLRCLSRANQRRPAHSGNSIRRNLRQRTAKKEVQEKLKTEEEEKKQNAVNSQRKFDARPDAR